MPAVKVGGYGVAGDVTPTTRASDATPSAAGSPLSSGPPSPRKRALSKEEVLGLQQDLIVEFSSPAFQKGLRQASSLHAAGKHAEYQEARQALVRDVQRSIIPKHGFPATDKGVEQMLLAVEDFRNDPDVSVNRQIIQEHLSSCEAPAASEDKAALPLGHDKKVLGKRVTWSRVCSSQFSLFLCDEGLSACLEGRGGFLLGILVG